MCFNIKSADESGTVLRYSATGYDNEILIYLSTKTQHQPVGKELGLKIVVIFRALLNK